MELEDDRARWIAQLKLANPEALTGALLAKLGAPMVPSCREPRVESLPLDEVSFRVVDLETSGIEPAHDEILEAAVFEVRAGQIRSLFHSLVRPRAEVPTRVLELTGITRAELTGAPPLGEVFARLEAAVSGDCVVAHDATHDVGFLVHAAWQGDPHWIHPPVACTLKLSRNLLPEQGGHSLQALAEHLHLPLPNHRARTDARSTCYLLLELLERAKQRGARTLGEFVALERRKPKPRPLGLISALTVEAVPTGPGVYRFYDAQRRVLYLGYSRDLRRRIREHLFTSTTPAAFELVRRACAFEVECHDNPLEAFLAEGRALLVEKPILNLRNSEHGKLRYFRLTRDGAVTLVATPSGDVGPAVRYLGPVIFARAERDVLRAVRDAFHLTARPPKRGGGPGAAGALAFASFGSGPLPDRPAHVSVEQWTVLLDVRRALFHHEAERLDETRLFRHPLLLIPSTGASRLYAVHAGRPTLTLAAEPTPRAQMALDAKEVSARERASERALAAWLAEPPTGEALDWLGTRLSAWSRAHPRELRLIDLRSPRGDDAASISKIWRARHGCERVVHG